MKATTNIRKIAQATLVTVAFLMVLVFTPVQAASVNSKEVDEAINRLETYNREVEKSISFYVPVLTETVEEYLEFEAAGLRLEEAVISFEKDARYVTPAVKENFEDLEVKEALENLDKLATQIEMSITYQAPSVTE